MSTLSTQFEEILQRAHKAGREAAEITAKEMFNTSLESLENNKALSVNASFFRGMTVELRPCNSKFANFLKRNDYGFYCDWRSAIRITPKLSGNAKLSRHINETYIDAFISVLTNANLDRVNLSKREN